MDALPDDVLLLILSRFHAAEELAQLASVSKRWWQLGKYVPNFRMLIPSSHNTERLLESVLSARVGLRKLDVSECGEVRGFQNLRSLDHHSSTIESLSLCFPRAAISIATEFPKLSTLDIQVRHLVCGLDGLLFRNLHECRLLIRSGISSASVESLLKACPALHTLSLRVTCWDSRLSLDSKILQHLTVEGAEFGSGVIELRMPRLKKLRLKDLTLSRFSCNDLQDCRFNWVGGIFGATVEALVKNSPMLHTLKVFDCGDLCSPNITLESTSLKVLSISGLNNRIEALELRTCNLEHLVLSQVERLTFHGNVLTPVSSGCPALKEMVIWISASDPTMNFQRYLIEFLKNSPLFVELTVHANDSWHGAVEELKSDPRFKHCKLQLSA